MGKAPKGELKGGKSSTVENPGVEVHGELESWKCKPWGQFGSFDISAVKSYSNTKGDISLSAIPHKIFTNVCVEDESLFIWIFQGPWVGIFRIFCSGPSKHCFIRK